MTDDCICCGNDTSFGSGRFANRMFSIVDQAGYICSDCGGTGRHPSPGTPTSRLSGMEVDSRLHAFAAALHESLELYPTPDDGRCGACGGQTWSLYEPGWVCLMKATFDSEQGWSAHADGWDDMTDQGSFTVLQCASESCGALHRLPDEICWG